MIPQFLFVLCLAELHCCHYIQKCCDLHQQLNRNFDACVHFDGTRGIERYDVDPGPVDPDGVNLIKLGGRSHHHIWWLPPEVQFLSAGGPAAFQPVNVSQVHNLRFLYNHKNPCPEFSQMLLPFNDYVFLLDNGSLLVTGITDGVRPETMMFPPKAYCLDRVSLGYGRRRRRSSHLLDHSFAIFVCPCLEYTCVRMCCHKRWHLSVKEGQEKCSYAREIPATWSLNYSDYDGRAVDNGQSFAIVEGIPSCDDFRYLNNATVAPGSFWLLPDGSVRLQDRRTEAGIGDYCIHYSNIGGRYRPNLRVCAENLVQSQSVEAHLEGDSAAAILRQMAEFQDLLYRVYFVTGATFLGLTLVVYGLLLRRRVSLFERILCGHVAALFVCYSMMAFDKIVKPKNGVWTCTLTGYVIHYSFVASTLWLNVMCLCIHQSFRGYNITNQKVDNSSSYKYLIYSAYVWGGAAIVSIGTFVADNIAILDSEYKPKIGLHSCWLQSSTAELIYFYSPVAVILASNLILFVFTLREIIAIQRRSRILNNQESKKYVGNTEVASKSLSFTLFVRLFSLTGITWIFEIVSWYIGGPDYYWYIPDALNSLRGVFVFIICCCKKEILVLVFKRPHRSRKQTSGATATTRHSSSSTKSTTIIQMVPLKKSDEASGEEST